LLAFCTALASCVHNRTVFGAYQLCQFACLTIQIKPDHTFVYRRDGDLFNDERSRGIWSYMADNQLRGIIAPKPPEVHESTNTEEDRFHVKVVDEAGATLQGALVSPSGASQELTSRTNYDGVAMIPRCDEFEVKFSGFHDVRYRPADSRSNEFTVTIPASSLTIDETWLMRGSRLYTAKADGSVDKHTYLRRLSLADEKKIFH